MTFAQGAELAYAVLRAYRNGLGEALPTWAALPQADKDKCIKRVTFFVLNHSTPQTIHDIWLNAKFLDGWSYGPVYQPAQKKTPYFVPFINLPVEIQARGTIFYAVIQSIVDQLPTP